jgi:hypothetical protein
VARVSQVKLHVPINIKDDLDMNISRITKKQLEHGYNEVLIPKPYKSITNYPSDSGVNKVNEINNLG